MTRAPTEQRERQLRDALGIPPGMDAHAKRYAALLKLGSPIAFARQTFEDRAALAPGDLKVRPRLDFDAKTIGLWHEGTPIPEPLKTAFAAWLDNERDRAYQIGELERRLRAAVCATLTLALSDELEDKRRAQAFVRWLADEWGVIGLKPATTPQGAQAIDEEIRAAVRRRAGR